jgi:hypothetical protein
MDDHLDELFAAPLDRFIEVRRAVVRQLESEGSTEAAAAVAAVRKPSVSVWVVNQLARSTRDDIADLVKAGQKLEAVQRGAITGDPITGFREARAQEAAAIARLERAAKELLPSITAQTLERVRTTLRAGAASSDGRALLAGGRLRHDLEPTGFDLFAAGFQPQPNANAVSTSKSDEAARRKLDALRSKARAAEEQAVVAAADAQRAADEADMAERRAGKAREEAASAAARAETARDHAARLAEQVALAEANRASPGAG